jgi:hypothetical protein
MAIQTNTYEARIDEPGNGVKTKKVDAAYFALEDRLIEFKDTDHKTVYAVRWDLLLSVERVELTGGPVLADSTN